RLPTSITTSRKMPSTCSTVRSAKALSWAAKDPPRPPYRAVMWCILFAIASDLCRALVDDGVSSIRVERRASQQCRHGPVREPDAIAWLGGLLQAQCGDQK